MLDAELIATLHSSTLADVLDTFGVWGVLDNEVKLVNGVEAPLFGSAYTVRWSPVRKPHNIMSPQPSTWDDVKHFLVPDVRDGSKSIYVGGVDGGLLKDLALAGGFSATDLCGRGFRGMILGGAIRDAHVVGTLPIPIWATNYTPADTQGNFRVSEVGTSCFVGRIQIRTGDFVFADASGCVVVPQHLVDEVLVKALDIERREVTIQEKVSAGESLWDVVHHLGRL